MTDLSTLVFLSYARKDGAALAARLRRDLVASGLGVWMDTREIDAGDSWSEAIESAVDRASAVVALMTNASFVSAICRAEHLRALRRKRRVIPVMAEPNVDRPLYFEHLHYVDFSNADTYAEVLSQLVRAITSGEAIPVAPAPLLLTRITVPPLPLNFVARPEAQAAIKALLLRPGSDAPVTGIRGMGGSGKTVLSQAICYDEIVQAAFPDGIAWISLGRHPGDLVAQVRAVGAALGDSPVHYATLTDASSRLRQFLDDRAALVVLDDVWNARDVEPFRVSARRCRLLFSTRDARIAAGLGSREFAVETLTPDQSRSVLARWAAVAVDRLPLDAAALIQLSGASPLALAMVGAMVRGKPHRWASVRGALEKAQLEKIGSILPPYEHADLLAALQVSIDELSPDWQRRYRELAVFPADHAFPESALATLWRTDPAQTEELVDGFVDLSLASRDQRGWIGLHALQHDYVVSRWTPMELEELHRRLLDTYLAKHGGKSTVQIRDEYSFMWLPYHVRAAGLVEEWRTLLLQFEWLSAKLEATDIVVVLADYSDVGDDLALTTVRRALTLSAHVLVHDKSQLAAQLQGRLLEDGLPEIRTLLDEIDRSQDKPWLRSLAAALPPASGPLMRTLLGHRAHVVSAEVSRDGKTVMSADAEGVVRVWALDTGVTRWTLTGHDAAVSTLLILPDNTRAVSADDHGEIRLWNLESGAQIGAAGKSARAITGLAIIAGGFVSLSQDGAVCSWTVTEEAGMQESPAFDALADIERGNTATAIAVHPNGRLALIGCCPSAQLGGERMAVLRLFDLNERSVVRTMIHSNPIHLVRHIAFSPDGAEAVTVGTKGVVVWDLASGQERLSFKGHRWGQVSDVAVLPGSRTIVTVGGDGLVNGWRLDTGEPLWSIPAHTNFAPAITATGDGRRVVTGSWDKTVKVWDLDRVDRGGSRAHTGIVSAVAVSPEKRRAYSASHDGSVKTWSLDTCLEVDAFPAHDDWILDMVVTPNGRWMLTGSSDGTAQLWEMETETARAMLPHPMRWARNALDVTTFVEPVALTPDGGCAVTGFTGEDSIVRVSDLTKPGEFFLRPATRREWSLNAVTIHLLPGTSHAVIGSRDRGCAIWDMTSGEMVRMLVEDATIAATVTSDGARLVFASGDSLVHVQSLAGGGATRSLEVPGIVKALSISPDDRYLSVAFGHGFNDTFSSGLSGGGVSLWILADARVIATLSTESAMRCCCFIDRDGEPVVVAGDESGRVYFLALKSGPMADGSAAARAAVIPTA